jgi:hypothetical protein
MKNRTIERARLGQLKDDLRMKNILNNCDEETES